MEKLYWIKDTCFEVWTGGLYAVIQKGGKTQYVLYIDGEHQGDFPTLEAAKSAAEIAVNRPV